MIPNLLLPSDRYLIYDMDVDVVYGRTYVGSYLDSHLLTRKN